MVRQTQEEAIRSAVSEAKEILNLYNSGRMIEALNAIRKGKWIHALNGKVIVKGLVELRNSGDKGYEIFIAGYKIEA